MNRLFQRASLLFLALSLALAASAQKSPETARLLKDGVAALDKTVGVSWMDLSAGYRLAALQAQSKLLDAVKGKAVARECIGAAMKEGSAWVEYYWYKPGSNTPARKQAYVRKVQSGQDTYIVGSGLYME